jgi:hypothetical protein
VYHTQRPLTLPFPTDTLRTDAVRSGVTHRFIYAAKGPWAINVLDVELNTCTAAIAVKGADGAIGREKTSVLVGNLRASQDVIAGVNADFFSLAAPPGVPTGTLVSRGRLITGPSEQPVLAFDTRGRPHVMTLVASGTLTIRDQAVAITGWNHAVPGGLALFDAHWGGRMDTASHTIEVVLDGRNPARVIAVDTLTAGAAIPADGAVVIAGRDTPAAVRAPLSSLRPGDAVRTHMALAPMRPREAVGGRPLLVRDSTIPGIVDTEGQPGFATGRHPRTAAGIARGGRQLILVVVDGRQMPYSDGMTLRELADLMLALGARDAINLDGGGSTTLVYAPKDSGGALRIANRPSDAGGERTVGDALAIVNACARR